MIPIPTDAMTALRDAAKAYTKNDKKADEQKWEQRRYEIAKEMLPVLYKSYVGSPRWQVDTALLIADELIKVLKGGESGAQEGYPQWVSVDDKLPPKDDSIRSFSTIVLVCSDTGTIGLDLYNHDDKKWVNAYAYDKVVTHWMPLPDAPKKGGKQ